MNGKERLIRMCWFTLIRYPTLRSIRSPWSSYSSVLKAIDLVRDHGVPFWDALIAACMLENGTENTRDFKLVPGIQAVNPFEPGR